MRLITKDLWRAFPELDRFDDDRCRRFVIAAQRGKRAAIWRILLNLILTASVAAAIGSIGLAIMWLFWDAGGGTSGPAAGSWRFAFGLFILCLAIVAAGLASLVFRDQLLRRRVAHFIFARGKCPQCRYNLLGVRVPESLRMQCPECGLELEVDPALTELSGVAPASLNPTGHASESPRQLHLIRTVESASWVPKWFTAARRRKTLLLSLALLGLGIAITASIWCWRWYAIEAQAKRAAALRVGLAGIDAITQSMNPNGSQSTLLTENAWDHYDRANDLRARAERFVNENSPDLASRIDPSSQPEYEVLADAQTYFRPYRTDENDIAEAWRAELARRYLIEMGRQGLWDALDTLAATPNAFRPQPPMVPGQPPDSYVVQLSELRNIVKFCATRMAVAEGHNDATEYCRALRAGLSVARLAPRNPTAVSWLIALSSERLLLDRVQTTVRLGASKPWLDAIQQTLASTPDPPPISTMILAEREYMRDVALWFFADPAQVRNGWEQFQAAGFEQPDTRVGTLEENLTAIDTLRDLLLADLNRTVSQRSSRSYDVLGDLMSSQSATPLRRTVAMADALTMHRRAVTIHLAIERFLLDHAQPPESLAALVPGYLSAVPPDPLAPDGRFIYRRVTPIGDATVADDYLFYSVGTNGIDNGGTDSYDALFSSIAFDSPKGDFVIHCPPHLHEKGAKD